MTAKKLVLALCTALALGGNVFAEIYKTVDSNGNVAYTDVPPKKDEAGESLILKQGNIYNAPEAEVTPPTVKLSPEGPLPLDEPGLTAALYQYSQLSITWPTHDLDIRENAGNVTVSVAADPYFDPASGHQIQVLIDGTVYPGVVSGTDVALKNLDRGTHSLQAQIIDGAGQILIASTPITFHLKRHSALFGG